MNDILKAQMRQEIARVAKRIVDGDTYLGAEDVQRMAALSLALIADQLLAGEVKVSAVVDQA